MLWLFLLVFSAAAHSAAWNESFRTYLQPFIESADTAGFPAFEELLSTCSATEAYNCFIALNDFVVDSLEGLGTPVGRAQSLPRLYFRFWASWYWQDAEFFRIACMDYDTGAHRYDSIRLCGFSPQAMTLESLRGMHQQSYHDLAPAFFDSLRCLLDTVASRVVVRYNLDDRYRRMLSPYDVICQDTSFSNSGYRLEEIVHIDGAQWTSCHMFENGRIVLLSDNGFVCEGMVNAQNWSVICSLENISASFYNSYIHFANALHGWIVDAALRLWFTEDGGYSWTRDSSTLTYRYQPESPLVEMAHEVQFGPVVSTTNGVALSVIGASMLRPGIYARQTDGTWNHISESPTNIIAGNAINATTTGWFSQSIGGLTVHYGDSVAGNWTTISDKSIIRCGRYVDEQTAVALGSFGYIWYTSNGGASWDRVFVPYAGDFRSVGGLGRTLVAVGQQGTIYFSRDGGKRWAYPGARVNNALTDVAVLDSSSALILSNNGIVYRFFFDDGQSICPDSRRLNAMPVYRASGIAKNLHMARSPNERLQSLTGAESVALFDIRGRRICCGTASAMGNSPKSLLNTPRASGVFISVEMGK
jgi:photosystem II stability/assembly factor-like uncharacterized protein